MIPPITQFEGVLPDEGDPITFKNRAADLMAWLTGQFAPELGAGITGINNALSVFGEAVANDVCHFTDNISVQERREFILPSEAAAWYCLDFSLKVTAGAGKVGELRAAAPGGGPAFYGYSGQVALAPQDLAGPENIHIRDDRTDYFLSGVWPGGSTIRIENEVVGAAIQAHAFFISVPPPSNVRPITVRAI